MSKFTIYSKDNVARRESLTGTTGNDGAIVYGEGLEYNGSWMGECFITVTIHSAYPVNFQMGDYITYRGEKFVLNYDPSVVKKAARGTYGEGFTYESIKFNSLGTELTDVNFLDYVLGDNGLHYTSLPTFPFHAADIDDYCDRLQANTNRWCAANGFAQADYWVFLTPVKTRTVQRLVDSGFTSTQANNMWNAAYGEGTNVSDEKKDVHVEVSNETVWNALTRIKNDFGLNFINRDRKVIVCSAGLPTSVFSYGKGNGLYEIERVADSEQAVITKLFAYGSEKNMPVRYYANLNASIFGYMYGREDATNNVIYLNVRYSTSYLTTSDGSGKYNVTVKIDNTSYSAKAYSTQVGSQGLLLTISPATSGAWSGLTITSSTKIYFTAGVKIDSWTGQTETNSDMPNNMAVNRLMLPGFPNQSLYAWVIAHGGTAVTDSHNNSSYGRATWTYNNVEYDAFFSKDALQPYILSTNFTELGVREASKLFDGSDDTEEIYPTIEGTGLDIIASAEVIKDNGVFTEGEDEPSFDIYLPDFGVGFDLKEQAKQGTQDGGSPTIFMKSGYCGSREFSFTADDVKQETSGTHSGQWKVRAKREHDDLLDLYFPYSYGVSTGQQATANEAYQVRGNDVLGTGNGDKYVLTGIPMTSTYVEANAQKLLGYSLAHLAKNDYTRYTFTPRVDEIFMARDHETNGNNSIYSKIKEGDLMQFEEEDFGIETGSVFIDTLFIKEDGNNGVPTFDVTLRNDKQVGTIQRIQEKIDSLASSIAGGGWSLDVAQIKELIISYGAQKFLSKLNDDMAQGFITFIKGLQVGNQFVSGLLGEGGIFNKDTNGKTYIETDKLYVRMKAYFDTVEIRKYLHSGGNRIASVAGAKIVRVEGLDSSGNVTETAANIVKYRCYFRGSDGDAAVSNDFVIGDQVYCHITNVTSGSSLYQHHYWRLCVGKSSSTNSNGEHYVDLSNRTSETISSVAYSGYQTGSDVPLEQDDIIQLGNVNDSDRRGAIVEYVSGNDAPSYQIFQGLGDIGTASTIEQKQAAQYTLEGKNYIGLGYDSSTGRAYMNVFGDFYFGDKPVSPAAVGNSYIKYNAQTKQLDIKARINAQSTIGGDSIEQYIKDHQNNYDDTAVLAAIGGLEDTTEDLQRQIDGAIETWFMTGVPTLLNAPAVDWTTDDEKDKHIGDLYYDKATGHGYRFMYDDEEHVYLWTILTDEDVTEALRIANEAQATADGKMTIYSTWGAWIKSNVNTLQVGDLYIPASNYTDTSVTPNKTYYAKKVYKCKTDATNDFEEINYTDDTTVNTIIQQYGNILSITPTATDVGQALAYLRQVLGGSTQVDGGLILTNAIYMKNAASTPAITAGITGVSYSSETGTGYKGYGTAAWYGGGVNNGIPIDHEVSPSLSNYAKSLFRFDGSGYLAGGNITWTSSGQLTISDLYTMVSGDTTFQTDVLNKATLFANLFHSSTTGTTVGTLTRILPQAPFQYIDIKRGSDTLTEYSVLNRGEMDSRYIRVDFFNRLFQAYKSTTINDSNKVAANDVTTAINNLKIMVGAWTDQYLSALGLDSSSGSGGGGTGDVTWEALASSADTHQIALSHFENALTGYAKLRQANDFVYNSNEVTFVPANYNSYLWLNYRAGTGTGNISAYYMGNGGGSGGFASVVAASFVRNGGTSAQFLKADGSVDSNSYLTSVAFSNLTSHPTTLAGYGITDAYIASGTVYLGSNSITPLTSITSSMVTTALGYTPANSTSLADYLPLTGGTINANNSKAPLILKGGINGYREGLRIIPYGSWSDILLGGTDVTEASGTSAKSWFLGNNDGDFYITKNGSTSGTTYLSCVSNVWAIDGNTIWHAGNLSPLTTTNYSSYALPLAGGTLTGALGKSSNYLIKPVADYRTTTGTHTGCITITLPASVGPTMVSMWVDVYNYSTNTSFSVHCGGYAYDNSTWQYNPFAMCYGAQHRVRFGHNGTSYVIYIGETDSTWSYPQVTVRDVILGYQQTYNNWCNNWSISFSTSVSNITADITHYAITTKNISSQSVSNADTVDSQHATRFGWVYNSSGIGNSSSVTVNDMVSSGGSNATFAMINSATDNPMGKSTWVHVWSQSWGINTATSWVSQIAIGTENKNGLWYRTNGSGTIVGKAWTRVLDASCYSSYALPLTGGTITGLITVDRGTSEIFQTKGGNSQLHITDSYTILGYSNPISGINTYIDGRNIIFRCGTNHTTGMYINSSANVGIGTTSPSCKLEVAGTIKAATTGATATLTYTSLSLGSSGAGAITLALESTNKLKITADTTYTTGGFYSNSYVSALGQNTSSDIRKKNVIGNVELDINDIAAAPSVKYLWKDKDLGLQAGSIAQYWQNVLPECVHTEMDGYLSMEYGVIALLASIATANEVKSLRKRVSELEREVKQLKAA